MSEETSTPRAGALQRLGETAAARLAWVVAKALVTAVVTGSIAMATGYVREMRDDIRTATQRVDELRVAQHDTDGRVANLKQVSDATVVTLQQLGNQVTRHGFDIEQLKDAATADAVRSRPHR